MSVKIDQYWVTLIRIRPAQADQWSKLTGAVRSGFLMLRDLATKDGYVFAEVSKGMYGLPQSGILAQKLLEERLGDKGYTQSTRTPGLWTHK